MTVEDVKRIMNLLGVDPLGYRIQDAPGESTWCIRRQGRTWLVFFFERGRKYHLERFNEEAVACDFFLGQVMPDWKDRLGPSSGPEAR